jgi:hypothetical protein
MLVYLQGRFITQVEGRFMQVLEGTEHYVEEIFQIIQKDPRHHQLLVLNRDIVAQQYFETWEMGFELVDVDTKQILKASSY